MTNSLEALFFDLDGTLLHTAPDLIHALNQVLHLHHRAPIPLHASRDLDYTGSESLLTSSLGMDKDHPEFAPIKEKFIQIYEQHSTERTDFFPGMSELLAHLDENAITWGVITNKPEFLTLPLMQHFNLHERSHCIIAGDTLAKRKPHPDQLLHACEITHVLPEQAWYVGDAHTDVTAAKAAGMTSIAVTYGYHDKKHPPKEWDADFIVNHPGEILQLVRQHR